jgi:pimeloyl-ACP methyl ester carboxylesterase
MSTIKARQILSTKAGSAPFVPSCSFCIVFHVDLKYKRIKKQASLLKSFKAGGVMKKFPIIFCMAIIVCLLMSCQDQTTPDAPGITNDYVASRDRVYIHYQVQGKGTPAIVFVHGWSCDLKYWEKQWAPFAEKYTVVSIDLAGHGRSGLNRESWTIPAFGEDVVAVVKKLGLSEIVLVGHSMGGSVILEAAKQIPDQVLGIVGVDTLQDIEQKWTREQFDQYFAPFQAGFKEATKNFVRSMFVPDSDPVLVERIVDDMSSAPPEVGLASFEGNFDYWQYNVAQAFRETKAPITCINSDMWPSNPEGNKRINPSFKLKIMAGLGHFIMLEDPETFNRLLEETVQEFLLASASIANRKDVSTIDGLVSALYESITFPAGEKPDLERFKTLFIPNAPFIRIIPGGPNTMNLASFVSSFMDRVESGVLKSFYEAEISRRTQSFGSIAHVFSTYKKGMNAADSGSLGRGINSIQLFYDGKRWWASGITWEDERDDNLIPDQYLR